MPLKDLLVSEQAVTEGLVEEILSDFVHLAQDTRRAILTTEGARLGARPKVLLVLTARHAWRFISSGQEQELLLHLREIGEQTGLPGNTLRPVIKRLKDDRVIDTPQPGYYLLPPYSLANVAKEIGVLRRKISSP